MFVQYNISYHIIPIIHYFADLTTQQLEFQELARKFTAEEIIPVAAHHDQTGEVRESNHTLTY